jgi:hypothetical protein
VPDGSEEELRDILESITKQEILLNQGLLRVDELMLLTQQANFAYELASDHDSIQYRKYDKSRRSHTKWVPQRRNGYAEPEDGDQLRDLKQEITELLHLNNIEVEANEIFLPPGHTFLGRIAIRNILSRATTTLDIKDDYLFSADKKTKNIELLEILTPYLSGSLPLEVRLLGSSDSPPSTTLSDVASFLKQFPKVQIKGFSRTGSGSKETHDRFIIIDGKEVFTSGASVKDLGLAQSLIAQVEDPSVVDQHIKQFEEWWNRATTYKGL